MRPNYLRVATQNSVFPLKMETYNTKCFRKRARIELAM